MNGDALDLDLTELEGEFLWSCSERRGSAARANGNEYEWEADLVLEGKTNSLARELAQVLEKGGALRLGGRLLLLLLECSALGLCRSRERVSSTLERSRKREDGRTKRGLVLLQDFVRQGQLLLLLDELLL